MGRIAVLAGVASVALFASASSVSAEPTLVGIWFSPYQPDEDGVMSLIEFRSDGTFREEFRKCDGGDYVGYQTESGTWSLDGDTEHLVAEKINGDPANSASDYKIILLTDNERRIRLDPQGYVFVGHRVQTFDFPDCASGI
ncbi:MAG TPA: lipocalin family protein [Micropepsaceae bacterium]|nr:lipocalin family protein [Micropepsaceae bacterium]